MWQLKYQGKLVAEHSTRIACFTEAVERGLVQIVKGTRYMSPTVQVVELETET